MGQFRQTGNYQNVTDRAPKTGKLLIQTTGKSHAFPQPALLIGQLIALVRLAAWGDGGGGGAELNAAVLSHFLLLH
jgi:hypothetical protein